MNATLQQMVEGLGELTSKEMATLVQHINRIAEEGSRMDEGTGNGRLFAEASNHLERAARAFESIR